MSSINIPHFFVKKRYKVKYFIIFSLPILLLLVIYYIPSSEALSSLNDDELNTPVDYSIEDQLEYIVEEDREQIKDPGVSVLNPILFASTKSYTFSGDGYSFNNCNDSNSSPGILDVSFIGGHIEQNGNVFTSDQSSISFSWNFSESNIDKTLCFYGKNIRSKDSWGLIYDDYGTYSNQFVADGIHTGPIEYGQILVEKKTDNGKYVTEFYLPMWNDTSDNKVIGYGGLTISGDDYNKGTTYRISLMYRTYGTGSADVWYNFFGNITETVILNHIEVCELTVKTRNVDGAISVGTDRSLEPYFTIEDGGLIAGDVNLLFNNPFVFCNISCNDQIVFSYDGDVTKLPSSKKLKLSLDGKVEMDIWNEYGSSHHYYFACNDYVTHYSLDTVLQGIQQYSSKENVVSFAEKVIVHCSSPPVNHLPIYYELLNVSGNTIDLSFGEVTLDSGTYKLHVKIASPDTGSHVYINCIFSVDKTYNPSVNYQNLIKTRTFPDSAFEVSLPTKSAFKLHILFADPDTAYRFVLKYIGANGYQSSRIAWGYVNVFEKDRNSIATIDCDLIKISELQCDIDIDEDIFVYYSAYDRSVLTSNVIPIISMQSSYYSEREGTVVQKDIPFMMLKDPDGWESDTTLVIDSSGKSMKLSYNEPVLEQLNKMGLYGLLTFKEYNIHGGYSEYYVYNDPVDKDNLNSSSHSSVIEVSSSLLVSSFLISMFFIRRRVG